MFYQDKQGNCGQTGMTLWPESLLFVCLKLPWWVLSWELDFWAPVIQLHGPGHWWLSFASESLASLAVCFPASSVCAFATFSHSIPLSGWFCLAFLSFHALLAIETPAQGTRTRVVVLDLGVDATYRGCWHCSFVIVLWSLEEEMNTLPSCFAPLKLL